MRFELIDQAKAAFPVQRLCSVLGVSQSGYFAWKDRPACRRQRDDMVLLAHVRSAFALSNGTYGSPRMTRELRDSGLAIGRRRTARLMRENGFTARQKRRFKRTTDSQHAWPVAPNLLDQDFVAVRPDEKWGADISYVWTREGWLYLAVVIDLFARRAVGCPLGADPGDLAQPLGLLLDQFEHGIAERPNQLLGVDRADAADHARAQIPLDALQCRGWACLQEAGPELQAVGAVVHPDPAHLHRFAGADRGSMPDHGDQVALATHLDPEHAEAAVLVVERHPLHQPGQCLCRGRLHWRGHRHVPSSGLHPLSVAAAPPRRALGSSGVRPTSRHGLSATAPAPAGAIPGRTLHWPRRHLPELQQPASR
jgi:hypothetical protein